MNDYIDSLEDYLSTIADCIEKDTKNSIEKIQILAKINELVFWLQMYQDKYNVD